MKFLCEVRMKSSAGDRERALDNEREKTGVDIFHGFCDHIYLWYNLQFSLVKSIFDKGINSIYAFSTVVLKYHIIYDFPSIKA